MTIKSMKRLGLVTYSNTLNNYGQMLQTLATIEFFRKRGYEVSLLRERLSFLSSIKRRIGKMVHTILRSCGIEKMNDFQKWWKVSIAEHKQHPRYFENFRNEYFNLKSLTKNQIKKENFDVLVAGSDQIWSELNPYMYLYFKTTDVKKISIAPGIGITSYNDDQINLIREYLKDYSFITVRENAGKEMCHRAGREAEIILDPTFLLSSLEYDLFAEDMKIKDDYLFLYMLGADTALQMDAIYDYAKVNNLRVVYVASQGRFDEREKLFATVPQWLYLMKNAKYVITNSFHGMALSIIYNKKFLVLPITGKTKKMNDRIENLADIFSLQQQIYNGDISAVCNEIDYNRINDIIRDNKDHINQMLDMASL